MSGDSYGRLQWFDKWRKREQPAEASTREACEGCQFNYMPKNQGCDGCKDTNDKPTQHNKPDKCNEHDKPCPHCGQQGFHKMSCDYRGTPESGEMEYPIGKE